MADIICYMTQYLRKKGPIPVRTIRGHCLSSLAHYLFSLLFHICFSFRIKRRLSLQPKTSSPTANHWPSSLESLLTTAWTNNVWLNCPLLLSRFWPSQTSWTSSPGQEAFDQSSATCVSYLLVRVTLQSFFHSTTGSGSNTVLALCMCLKSEVILLDKVADPWVKQVWGK